MCDQAPPLVANNSDKPIIVSENTPTGRYKTNYYSQHFIVPSKHRPIGPLAIRHSRRADRGLPIVARWVTDNRLSKSLPKNTVNAQLADWRDKNERLLKETLKPKSK